jgi:hypothetical protein
MTALLPHAARALVDGGGIMARRVDLVVIGVLGLLLLEYDLLRTFSGDRSPKHLRPLGIAIAPLLLAVAIVIAHRWQQLRG